MLESWSYKKPKVESKPEPREEVTTPPLNLTFDVEHEGKKRKATMTGGGLYVFDKSEKFDTKPELPTYAAPLQKSRPQGVWIGVKKPFADGNVLTPAASRPSDFKRVKIGGSIKKILNLTKKMK